MTRSLKTYVKNKKNPVSTSRKSPQNYAACYLCENQELPILRKHVSDKKGSKTCEDIHLELLALQQVKNEAICNAKQTLYSQTCCPKSGGGSPFKTSVMTIFGAFVFWLIVSKRARRRFCKTVDEEDDDLKDYSVMEESEVSEETEQTELSEDHCSRRSKQKLRRQVRMPKKKKKKIKETDMVSVSQVSVGQGSVGQVSTMAVLAGDSKSVTTQVV